MCEIVCNIKMLCFFRFIFRIKNIFCESILGVNNFSLYVVILFQYDVVSIVLGSLCSCVVFFCDFEISALFYHVFFTENGGFSGFLPVFDVRYAKKCLFSAALRDFGVFFMKFYYEKP